jgi:hypothetical protein
VQQNRKDCEDFDESVRKYGSTDSLQGLANASNHDANHEAGNNHMMPRSSSSQAPAATYSRWQEIKRSLSLFKWHLVGTAGCWYLLDVDFYANGLFNHDVTATILSSNTAHTTALQDAYNSIIICLIGIPGYFICVYMIERVGRKAIQFNGFVCMAILFGICGAGYKWFLDPQGSPIRKWIFMAIYALTFMFRYETRQSMWKCLMVMLL